MAGRAERMITIQPREFSRDSLSLVQEFNCGSEEWAEFAARWIKEAPPFQGALKSMEKHGTRVWLYFACVDEHTEEILVGFSALGLTKWSIPGASDPKRTVGFLPMLAVAAAFQEKLAPEGKKYSHFIMEDVMSMACKSNMSELCLYVHPGNIRAINLYKRFGFRQILDEDCHGNLRMHKRIS